ncbi:MAG: hypothetical protein JW776_01325, partial [Candidatus Lokiarchaeota archaeon]|nr:hypothetical protein [Candidatus Lokiarchaeota archaeon]
GVYQYTASHPVNTYTYTIYANDTYGNQDSLAGPDIEVSDTLGPVISNIEEVSGDPTQFGTEIYIRVEITDNSTIDTVTIEFEGTNYTMIHLSGDLYYFTQSEDLGVYSYSIYANDTYGNENSITGLSIEVSDTTPPVMIELEEVSGEPTEFGEDVYITINVSHIMRVDSVWINWEGTNYSMTLLSGDQYNGIYNYTATYGIGTYTYTIYAKSSNDIENSVGPCTIEVADTTGPTLSNLDEYSGDPVEYGDDVEIRIDVTDLSDLDKIWITFSGTDYTMTVVSGTTYSYSYPWPPGFYSYSIHANDTYGNLATVQYGNIRVEDTTAPTISNVVEVSADPVEFGELIYIRVNISELSGLFGTTVLLELDGTNYTMNHIIDEMYYYTIATSVGIHNYRIFAIDTYGNTANTSFFDITVEDTTNPILSSLEEVNGDPVEYNDAIYVQVNVTDLSALDEVLIEINGINYSMVLDNFYDNEYLFYYIANLEVKFYSYTIYANDTYGNEAIPISSDITVEDTVGPALSNLIEVSGDPTQPDEDIYIRINVTDVSTIDYVWITFAGTDYTMTYLGGDMYYYSTTQIPNTYSYTIHANDTYGNLATPLPGDITVEDTLGPELTNLMEVNGDPVEFNGTIYIRVNITDVSSLDSVLIDFGGTNYSMTLLSGIMYYYTAAPGVGTFSYTIYANDTHGNEATSLSGTITVEDTTAPTLNNLVEVSGDPVAYNTTVTIRVNVTDLSLIDSIWITIGGNTYDLEYMSGDMYNFTGILNVGLNSYTIYVNDTYNNVQSISGDITVSEYVQYIIDFDILDYSVANLTADTDFVVTLPFNDSSTLDWAKVYFKIESGLQASTPIDWTSITLVNGQATISSEYFDAGEVLSYYFEIKDTYGVTFYVSSSGISTSNTTSQTNVFSFHITAVPRPPFEFPTWAFYIIGGVAAVAILVSAIVAVRKAKSKREILDIQGAEDATNALLEQHKSIQKEAIKAEKANDFYTAVTMYEKLIEIANELFKYGQSSAIDNIKNYRAKIAKYQKKAQKSTKPGGKQALQQTAAEYLKMAEDYEDADDFGNALIIYHQILLLREEIKDKSQISATKAKIKNAISNIPEIREISAKLLVEAEEKYKAKEYLTAYSNYRYLRTIFDALGDKTLISTIDKLISEVTKHL